MTDDPKERLHAIVYGRVQGVGFRSFVVQSTLRLKVTGWVRNRWDETVEVVAEGEKSELEKLLAALQNGPRSAWVEKVEVEWLAVTGEYSFFRMRETF